MSCGTFCSNTSVGCASCSNKSIVGNIGAPLSHAEARVIINRAWQLEHGRFPNENELNLTQAIAFFETGYGRIGQFAKLANQGMFNWGALQRRRNPDGSCPAGTAPGSDAGNPRCFYVFSSDLDAARRYIWELTKNPNFPNRIAATVTALRSGTPDDVANAMKVSPAWYEAPVSTYAAAIRNGLKAIGGAVSKVPVAASSMAKSTPSIVPLILGGALGVGIWWWFSKRRPARR